MVIELVSREKQWGRHVISCEICFRFFMDEEEGSKRVLGCVNIVEYRVLLSMERHLPPVPTSPPTTHIPHTSPQSPTFKYSKKSAMSKKFEKNPQNLIPCPKFVFLVVRFVGDMESAQD